MKSLTCRTGSVSSGLTTMTEKFGTGYVIKTERDFASEAWDDGYMPSDVLTELDTRRKQRSRGRKPKSAPGTSWRQHEAEERRNLLSSPELLRGLLEADLEAKGITLEDALATMKRGRIAAQDRPIHDLLARHVARLHERGAELTTLARAIGKDRRSVEQLVVQGQAPCRRHDAFQADCPGCLGI
jgi:hypothetical protein